MTTSLRRKTYLILEISRGRALGINRVFNLVLISIITLNAISIVLHTVPAINAKYEWIFVDFEFFSVMFFTVEYLLRIWCCVENHEYEHPFWGRVRYVFSLSAMIDLLAIAPFYLTHFASDLAIIRVLRLFRIFRLFRISKYVSAVSIIREVVKDKREELVVSTVFILFMLIIASSVMYYVEHPAQPEAFSSIPATLWWGVCTMTSVGYGDIVPQTAWGKLFGGIIAMMGVGLFALPTGILVSGFAEEVNKQKQPQKHQCPHCGQDIRPDTR